MGGYPSNPIPGIPTQSADGMVDELVLISTGAGYSPNGTALSDISTLNISDTEINITTEEPLDIQTDEGGNLIFQTKGTGDGVGLTVTIGQQRTTKGGITSVSVYSTGYNYKVGDVVSIDGSKTPAFFEVTKVKTESPVFGTATITTQNNYLILPDDVIGVNEVLKSQSMDMTGIFPGGSVFPMMLGGMLGNDQSCGDQGYGLTSYVAMREYMSTLEFLFFPPIQYSFNQRTHRLFIASNNFQKDTGVGGSGATGKMLALDCMVKPSPDVYPDLWNDLWLKEYAVALVKCQWGRNLTKFQQVQLPGGITMNGDQILQMGREDVQKLKDRFAMDWADIVLDEVG
jgi:hypothetical protein